MFNLGWTEILVIATIAIIIVGPRDLPGMLKSAGQFLGRMRRMASDFQKTFNDAIKDAERQVGVDEIRKGVDSVKQLNPVNDLKKTISVDNLINSGDKAESENEVQNNIKQPSNSIESAKNSNNATSPDDQTKSNITKENVATTNSNATAMLKSQSNQSTSESDTTNQNSTTVTPKNTQKIKENPSGSTTSLVSEKSAA